MQEGLDISAPAPRVNFQLMSQYIGKKVTLVGKFESVEGSTMKLRTSDDGLVNIQLHSMAPQATFIEVEGMVESPNTITAENCCNFGDNFDLSNYDQLCKLANGPAYRHMFLA